MKTAVPVCESARSKTRAPKCGWGATMRARATPRERKHAKQTRQQPYKMESHAKCKKSQVKWSTDETFVAGAGGLNGQPRAAVDRGAVQTLEHADAQLQVHDVAAAQTGRSALNC